MASIFLLVTGVSAWRNTIAIQERAQHEGHFLDVLIGLEQLDRTRSRIRLLNWMAAFNGVMLLVILVKL
jgi:hypothetical protein